MDVFTTLKGNALKKPAYIGHSLGVASNCLHHQYRFTRTTNIWHSSPLTDGWPWIIWYWPFQLFGRWSKLNGRIEKYSEELQWLFQQFRPQKSPPIYTSSAESMILHSSKYYWKNIRQYKNKLKINIEQNLTFTKD